MSLLKSILRKLVFISLFGIFILALLYIKDDYLNQGDKEAEILNEIVFQNDKISEKPLANTFTIEVDNIQNNVVVDKPVVTKKIHEIKNPTSENLTEPAAELDFEKFKESMQNTSTADAAFDDLEKELNN